MGDEFALPPAKTEEAASAPVAGTGERCSFCGKAQEVCGFLVQNRLTQLPRCFICDDCVLFAFELAEEAGLVHLEWDLVRQKVPALVQPVPANGADDSPQAPAGGKA
jgi:hypothetical protein